MGSTVRHVVRDVVAARAPGELALLDTLLVLDDEEVGRALRGRARRGDTLGFGIAEATAVVVPVVWLVVDEVVNRGVGAAADSVLGRLRSRFGRRGLPEEAAEVPALTREQLVVVHQLVVERGAAAGIGPKEAEALADAVVSRLARDGGE
ncbi:hypothetical protein [Streptomyces avicenniae]|uniref:hypothetical protein n=1 Tax=Streptomyces avicenniae TaxID=500153 RepID=UPI000699CB62|nr:hypothetical protein [Streptomyces avicenniae]